jgi:hypothetical protein
VLRIACSPVLPTVLDKVCFLICAWIEDWLWLLAPPSQERLTFSCLGDDVSLDLPG